MADIRKVKLRKLEKKIALLAEKHPSIDLNNLELRRDINDFLDFKKEAFYLKFDIEHCSECSQLLPKYKKEK